MALGDSVTIFLGDDITVVATNNTFPITIPRVGELIERGDGVLRQVKQIIYKHMEPHGIKVTVYTEPTTWEMSTP